MADSTEISDSTVEEDARRMICSFCKVEVNLDSGETIYSCRSCAVKTGEKSGEKIWNCIGCIGSCACQKHTIEDENGYEVTICAKHRMINEYFCEKEECKSVLCSRCLLDHLNHICVPAYKKSKEVRSEVFNYTNKLDSLSKDMKHRQQLQFDCRDSMNEAATLCCPDQVAEVLLGFMRELINKLIAQGTSGTKCNQLIATFKTEHEKILEGADRTTVAKQIDTSEALTDSLCKVLTKSDVVLVDNFTNMISSLDDSLKDQRSTLDSHVYCQPMYVRDENMKTHASNAVSVFLNSMNWPTVKTINYSQVKFHKTDYSAHLPANFKLISAFTVVTGHVFLVGTDENWMAFVSSHNKVQNFPASITAEVTNVTSLFGYADQNHANQRGFVVQTNGACYMARPLANPNSNEVPVEQIFPELDSKNLVAFYITSGCSVNCLVYDDQRKVIKPCDLDAKIRELKAPSKPSLFCLNYNRTTFAMTFGNSTDITVITNDSTETIPAVEHGFRSLDALQLIYDRNVSAVILLAWDFNRQIFGVFRQNRCDFKWILVAVFKCNFAGIDMAQHSILGVETDSRSILNDWDTFYITLENINCPFACSLSSFVDAIQRL